MSNCPENVKRKINSIIEEMSDKHWLFSSNPGHDFMRQSIGKLSFDDTMRLVLTMGKGTSSTEMIRFFNMNGDRMKTLDSCFFSEIFPEILNFVGREFVQIKLLYRISCQPISKSIVSQYFARLTGALLS